MKQFLSILRFEYSGYIKNKVFMGITISIVLILAILLSLPRLTDLSKSDDSSEPISSSSGELILIRDETGAGDMSLSYLSPVFPEDTLELTDMTQEQLQDCVSSGECSRAIIITGDLSYTYIVDSLGIYDSTQLTIEEALASRYQAQALTFLGLTAAEAGQVINAAVTGELVQLGKDQSSNFMYTYILIMLLYMAIMVYGQLVANSVAIEKGSRAMDLLITSARPRNLMFGKVIGSGLAGLTQLGLVLGSAFLFFELNRNQWAGNAIINSIFNIPLPILLYTILFFILGYFIYAFLFGAVGSMASKVEDINTTSLPVMFLMIAVFLLVVYALAGGTPDSTIMVIASFIPVSSPMAMFVRIAMSQVPLWQVATSIGILILSTFGIGYLSAKIYQVGVLLYGKPPKLGEILKAMKTSKA